VLKNKNKKMTILEENH